MRHDLKDDTVSTIVAALRRPEELMAMIAAAWAAQPKKVKRIKRARILQVHYKPGERARILVQLTVRRKKKQLGGKSKRKYLFVQIYADAERAARRFGDIDKRRLVRCYGPPLGLAENWNAVLWSLPNCPHLLRAKTFFWRREFAKFMVANGLIERAQKKQVTLPRLIRYVPRKRALFYVKSSARPQAHPPGALYIKVYSHGLDRVSDDNLNLLAAAAAAGGLGFSPPRMIVHDPRNRAVVLAKLPGRRLTKVAVRASPDVFSAVGRALAGLHGSAIRPTAPWRHADEIEALRRATLDIEIAFPGHGKKLAALRGRVERRARNLDFSAQQAIHRNLFGDQILIDGGQVGIVDWDDLSLGDPLYDLGRLIAHLLFVFRRRKAPVGDVTRAVNALVNAYCDGDTRSIAWQRLRWHCAVSLIMRAKISALRPLKARAPKDVAAALRHAKFLLRREPENPANFELP